MGSGNVTAQYRRGNGRRRGTFGRILVGGERGKGDERSMEGEGVSGWIRDPEYCVSEKACAHSGLGPERMGGTRKGAG